MTDHEYDPDLPYVVENKVVDIDNPLARFRHREDAEYMAEKYVDVRVIDTTPKPRVPEDAKFITWPDGASDRWFAERTAFGWKADNGTTADSLDDLPGVTPDTVFTVLDERKS